MRRFALTIVLAAVSLIAPRSSAETIVITPNGDVGRCSVAMWKLDWPNCEYEDGVKEGHLSIVSRDDKNRFRVDYAVWYGQLDDDSIPRCRTVPVEYCELVHVIKHYH